MKTAWYILALTTAALLELALGNFRLIVPLAALVTFYMTVVFGVRRVFLFAVATAVLIDAVLVRRGPATVLAIMPVFPLALFWRAQGDCQATVAQAIPGAVVGLFYGGILLVWKTVFAGVFVAFEQVINLLLLMEATFFGCLLLPFMVSGLDFFAEKLKLSAFRDAQQEYRGFSDR